MCGCMGLFLLLLVRVCVFLSCVCVCLPECARLHLLFRGSCQTVAPPDAHCNCIPSYMTAVFPYRRVCERQRIMFTCTHRESLTRQGSKQTAIIKTCCWSLIVFNQRKPAKETEHISLWLSVKGGITLPSFRVPFNFTTCSSHRLHLHY